MNYNLTPDYSKPFRVEFWTGAKWMPDNSFATLAGAERIIEFNRIRGVDSRLTNANNSKNAALVS